MIAIFIWDDALCKEERYVVPQCTTKHNTQMNEEASASCDTEDSRRSCRVHFRMN